MKRIAWGGFAACVVLLWTAIMPAHARVTAIDFTSKKPYGTFRGGDYVLWEGRVRGELAPGESIPDLDKPEG